MWKYLVANSTAVLDAENSEGKGRWGRSVNEDLPGDSVCIQGRWWLRGSMSSKDSSRPPTPFPLPSLWEHPIRGNAFAVPIPSGMAVTWAVWLMVWCHMTWYLLLSGTGKRNSPIHTPHCSLIVTSFCSPLLEPQPQWGLRTEGEHQGCCVWLDVFPEMKCFGHCVTLAHQVCSLALRFSSCGRGFLVAYPVSSVNLKGAGQYGRIYLCLGGWNRGTWRASGWSICEWTGMWGMFPSVHYRKCSGGPVQSMHLWGVTQLQTPGSFWEDKHQELRDQVVSRRLSAPCSGPPWESERDMKGQDGMQWQHLVLTLWVGLGGGEAIKWV